MKLILLLIPLSVVFLFGAGCETTPSPEPMNLPSPAPSSSLPFTEQISAFAAMGTISHQMPFPTSWKRPTDIPAPQIRHAYILSDDAAFVFAEQRNSNTILPTEDGSLYNGPISFAGVLFSSNRGETWERIFSIPTSTLKDETGQVVHLNPIGMSWKDGKYALDIVDDRGAGSGEGNLARLWTKDGSFWEEELRCYYYLPETYFYNQIPFEAPEGDFDPPMQTTVLKPAYCPIYLQHPLSKFD